MRDLGQRLDRSPCNTGVMAGAEEHDGAQETAAESVSRPSSPIGGVNVGEPSRTASVNFWVRGACSRCLTLELARMRPEANRIVSWKLAAHSSAQRVNRKFPVERKACHYWVYWYGKRERMGQKPGGGESAVAEHGGAECAMYDITDYVLATVVGRRRVGESSSSGGQRAWSWSWWTLAVFDAASRSNRCRKDARLPASPQNNDSNKQWPVRAMLSGPRRVHVTHSWLVEAGTVVSMKRREVGTQIGFRTVQRHGGPMRCTLSPFVLFRGGGLLLYQHHSQPRQTDAHPLLRHECALQPVNHARLMRYARKRKRKRKIHDVATRHSPNGGRSRSCLHSEPDLKRRATQGHWVYVSSTRPSGTSLVRFGAR
ncbi:uncharacterized protein MYCFIDRAFT_169320 [Pseudocercospora fijiensis CIRAD86]|uniref:Uncharacterized protein n=1 Tax=Pseudocercospora fijiensis (strain CIRAD86) TaxID=383855 RepID=N1Q5X8_PSEFD|nr:uncharacterized protein MYCFIDRAFT_169320 [Pseudocercospora fijiensis CIRAD86]EME87505.1 hypothetical protein MYCFIDRAFT_169320 [Pseudocercospora fijiensis CIRAD86]